MKGRKSIAWVLVCCVLFCLLNVCGATDDVNVEENQEPLLIEPTDAVEPQEEILEEETDQPQPETDMDVSQNESAVMNDEVEQEATADLGEVQAETANDRPEDKEPVGASEEAMEPEKSADQETNFVRERSSEADTKPSSGQNGEREPTYTEGTKYTTHGASVSQNPVAKTRHSGEKDQENGYTGGETERSEPSQPSQETEDSHEGDIPATKKNGLANGPDGQMTTDSQIENENLSAKNGEAKPVNPDADPANQGGIVTSESDTNQSDSSLSMIDSLEDRDSSADEKLSKEGKSDLESVPENKSDEPDEASDTGMAGGYTEETLIQMGCKKALIQAENGAELFEQPSEEAEQTGRIEKGQEVWVLQTTDETWAEVHLAGRMAPEGYVRWEDLLIIQEEHGRGKEEPDKQETVAEQAQEITPEEVHRGIAIEEASDEFTENESTVISDPDRPPGRLS